ncbi:hypothetical protein [Desulfothermus sp.]
MGGEVLHRCLGLTIPWGILTFVFGIFSGGLLISLFSMLLGKIKKIKFYEKLSIQMLRMSFFSFVLFLILDVSFIYSLIYVFKLELQFEQIKELFLQNLFIQIDVYLIVGAIFLLIILYLLKNSLKKYSGIFILILAIINILLWTGIYASVMFKFYYFKSNALNFNLEINNLLIPKDIYPVLIFWSYFFLSIGAASLYGTFYLMIRRNRDDFGRDYYKFSIPACARWSYGLIFFLIILIFKDFLVFGNFKQFPLMVWEILGGISLVVLLVFILNHRLIRSDHPIRLKEIMLLNPILGVIINVLFVISSS